MWGLQKKKDIAHILVERSSERLNITNVYIFVNN